MTRHIGVLTQIGVAQETARGVAEDAAQSYIPHFNVSMHDEVEKIVDESSVGIMVDGTGDAISKIYSTGELEGKLGAETSGHVFKALLGGVTTVDNGDATYTHTFNLTNTSQHPSLTVFLKDGVQGYKYPGAMIGKNEINVALGKYITFKSELMGKQGIEVAQTPGYSSEAAFLPQHSIIKFAPNVAGLAAATGICAEQLTLSHDKSLQGDQCIGSLGYADIISGVNSITGTAVLTYRAKDFHDDMINDAVKVLQLKAVNAGVTIGSGTQNPEFEFVLHHVKIQSFVPQREKGGIVKANLAFKAYYDIDAGKALEVKLTNTTADYNPAA